MKRILAVVVMFLAAACNSDDGDSITVYSGRSEDLVGPIFEDFTEETGVEVNARYESSENLALLITEEGSSTPADVFISQSPGAIGFLANEDRLTELPTSVLDLVPSELRDVNGRWVGVTGRQRVLVYNPNMVDAAELPTSVFELTDPAWQGRIGIAPANGSFQDFVSTMRARVGDSDTAAWLDGIAENAETYPNNSGIVAAVGRGEVAAGLVNHYYNFRALAEDPNHGGLNHQLAPEDPGSILIITGAAIVDESDNTAASERFIDYLLGADAQRYFADETFEYPLAPGVPPAPVIPPAEFGDVGSIDFSALGGGLSATRDLIIGAGLEG